MTVESPGRRRRGAELENSILEATWAELMETGYARLTMEGVAARAQTGKQVLYRRWPSRPELVLAAVRAHVGSILDAVPDTGSLREDAMILLRHMARRQRELGAEIMRGLMVEAVRLDPDALHGMADLWLSVVERATKRGEIGPGPVPTRIVMAAGDLLRFRMLLSEDPVTEEMLTQLADEIFLPLIRTHASAA